MHVVENTIDIARPAEAVFDYCADMRTEASWNPAVKSIRLTMRIELLPTGLMALLAPLTKAMMRPTARANMTRIKAAVGQWAPVSGRPVPVTRSAAGP